MESKDTENMILKYYICLIFSLLTGMFASAQQVVVTELPTQRLLPVAHIHRIFQDSEGYMWYGTEGGGLCRDNGYQVDVFRSDLNTPQLLSSNDITCIAEDKAHHIWFGTKNGLYILNKANYQITGLTDNELGKPRIDAILATHDGTVWVSAQSSIFHYSTEGKRLACYPSLWKNQSKAVSDLYEDSQHRLWVLQWDGGILQYDPSTKQFKEIQWECSSSPTQMIEDIEHQCFWVGTWGKGVVRFTLSADGLRAETCHPQPSTFADSLQNFHKAQVLGLLRDSRQGILWVSALDDLYAYRIKENQLQPMPTENFLSKEKKILDRIIEDHSSNIWIPGYAPHSFILSFDRNKIKRFPVPAMSTATGYPIIADLTVQEGEYYWIWQGRTGLSLYHPLSDRISFASDFPEETGNFYISKCMERCHNQQGIWVAGNSAQVLHITHQELKMKLLNKFSIPDADRICCLHENEQNILWIGTENALYQYNGGQLKKIQSNTGIISGIATAQDGSTYFIANSKKLQRLSSSGKIQTISEGEDYSSVAISPDGTVWVSTLQGNVYSYSPKTQRLEQEINASNTNGDAVKDMIADSSGHIWILADQYVKEYNPKNQSFRILHNSDRFIDAVYFLSISNMEDGSICLGGIGAFCLTTPAKELDQSPNSIHPVVSSLKIDRAKHIVGINEKDIELSPYNTNLEVSFSTLEHLYADRISFAYRINGLSTTWNYLPQGINTAYITKLPKGNYSLELKATDVHGRWGQPITCLWINRLPAWYETWWAYTLYIIVALTIISGLLKIYFKRLRKKQKEQIDQQLERARFQFLTNITSSKVDEEFLNKAMALVEKNIDNSDYNVELFSDDMCMSRMNLYRKLQSITGQKPTEFIRSIRLKKATELLTTSSLTIVEIAEQVGFSTPSYFSKCFKEMYGVLPTQYHSKNS